MNFLTKIIRQQQHCYKTALLVAFLFLSLIAQSFATSGYETDLRSQTADDNYRYDATGNLQQDKQEEIAAISWTLSGKIAAVERVAGSQKPDLAFEYDALGNRTAKYLTPKRTDGTPNAALCMATFYVRDAQGNIMATYTKQGDEGTLQLDEQPIYGSSRLGVFRGSAATAGIVRGSRVYEASNLLGNVLLTFSDRKVAVGDGSYKADVTSTNDYYAFGALYFFVYLRK